MTRIECLIPVIGWADRDEIAEMTHSSIDDIITDSDTPGIALAEPKLR